MKKVYLIGLIISFVSQSALSQSDRHSITVAGWGAGNTYSNTIINPANIRLIPNFLETGLITFPLQRKIEFINSALKYKHIGFGFGITNYQNRGIEVRSTDTILPESVFDYIRTNVSGSFVYIQNNFSFGITGQYSTDNLNDNYKTFHNFNLGLSTSPTSQLQLGLTIFDITSNDKNIRLNSSYNFGYFKAFIDTENDLTKNYQNKLYLGIESQLLFKSIQLRIGRNNNKFASGFSFHINNSPLTINYAYSSDIITNKSIHFISLSIRKFKKSNHRTVIDKIVIDDDIIQYAQVNISHLNVRALPQYNSNKLTVIQLNEKYEVLDTIGKWVQIKINNNITGWVYSIYVTII